MSSAEFCAIVRYCLMEKGESCAIVRLLSTLDFLIENITQKWLNFRSTLSLIIQRKKKNKMGDIKADGKL